MEAENTQWRKVKQMQPVLLCMHADNLRRHLKMYGPYYGGEKSAINVTMDHHKKAIFEDI